MKNPLPQRIKAKNVKAELNGSPAFVRNLYSMSVKNAEKSLSIASAISPVGSALGVQIFTHFVLIFITQKILK